MKNIKFFIFFLVLSSCNQYLGKVTPNYIPTNETKEIFLNSQIVSNKLSVNHGDIIYPKFISKNLIINNSEIYKIAELDENSAIGFFDHQIYISKDNYIYVIDNADLKNNYQFELNLNEDEYGLHFYEHNNQIYLLTNNSRLFVLNNQQDASMVFDYDFITNTTPILVDETLLIFSVFGDIYKINLNENNSIIKIINFKPNPGKIINSNIFYDKDNLYYLYNTDTLITFDKYKLEPYKNYIKEDLNILTSIGNYNELVDTPFSNNDYLYFLDRSGKIAVFNKLSSEIIWEYDVNNTILSYLFSENGYLTILTFDKILIFSEDGILNSSFSHNKESPLLIFNIQENIHLISKEGISLVNVDNNSEDSFIKNKFSSNLDIYYQGQNIYLKDDKSLFKLSE